MLLSAFRLSVPLMPIPNESMISLKEIGELAQDWHKFRRTSFSSNSPLASRLIRCAFVKMNWSDRKCILVCMGWDATPKLPNILIWQWKLWRLIGDALEISVVSFTENHWMHSYASHRIMGISTLREIMGGPLKRCIGLLIHSNNPLIWHIKEWENVRCIKLIRSQHAHCSLLLLPTRTTCGVHQCLWPNGPDRRCHQEIPGISKEVGVWWIKWQ